MLTYIQYIIIIYSLNEYWNTICRVLPVMLYIPSKVLKLIIKKFFLTHFQYTIQVFYHQGLHVKLKFQKENETVGQFKEDWWTSAVDLYPND